MLLRSAHLLAKDYVTKRRFIIGWALQVQSRSIRTSHEDRDFLFFSSRALRLQCIDVTLSLLLKPRMDIPKQDSELNEGAHIVSSLKELRARIKYEEHADITAFPLIVCDDQVSVSFHSVSQYSLLCFLHTHTDICKYICIYLFEIHRS